MRKLFFVWENFGPGHVDRCGAVANALAATTEVVGVELVGTSSTYEWDQTLETSFERLTIFPDRAIEQLSRASLFLKILKIALKNRNAIFFFCHYERPEIFALAVTFRLLGIKAIVMNDSKYDDYTRSLPKEIVKYIFYSPYHGGLASGTRSCDYLRFLGVPASKITSTYNTLSLKRLRANANETTQKEVDFADRHFTVIARLVPKKNIFVVLEAYSIYRNLATTPRRLVIAGSGPLEADLKGRAVDLGISDHVEWLGFVQTEAVSKLLTRTLALLLLSTEEQFGNVIIEAQAFSLPCIVSTNVGARDELIRSGVNGFVVEPDNSAGAAYFMNLLASDETLWTRMSSATDSTAINGDVSAFCKGVELLLQKI